MAVKLSAPLYSPETPMENMDNHKELWYVRWGGLEKLENRV
jgi:hypothetical protein